MFGLSFLEFAVICGIALLVFGPERLPELAKKLGTITGQLRRQSDALKREFYSAVYNPLQDAEAEVKTVARELKSVPLSADKATPPPPSSPTAHRIVEQNAPQDFFNQFGIPLANSSGQSESKTELPPSKKEIEK